MRQSPNSFNSLVSLLRVTGMDSPNRLAAGLCLGLCLGLLPKLSLLTWCLGAIAILSTANLLTLLIGFGCGCLLISAVDPLAIPLGERLLQWDFLGSLVAPTVNAPVWSLMQLDNSAMLGNLALSLLLSLPLFFCSRSVFNRIQPALENWLGGQATTGWMVNSATPTKAAR